LNPCRQVDNLKSWPLEERAVLQERGTRSSELGVNAVLVFVLHSTFRASRVTRVGIEPTLPVRAAALQAARWPTTRPKAVRLSSSGTGGIRTHTRQGLSLAALPVGVPCHFQVTGDRKQEPRTIQGAGRLLSPVTCLLIPEPPAGIEPTRPSYQDGKLPLHHKGVYISSTSRQLRAPSGSRTHTSAMARQ
jgi:hypothetical protein